MKNRSGISFLITFIAITVFLFPPPAHAQYFGRNKVQWERFDFEVLRTRHFDIYYYGELTPVVGDIGRMAERWYTRFAGVFHHELSERKPIVLYADHADFQQTTTTGGLIGEGTGGFTDAFQNRVVMPLTGLYADTDHVLGHELVHVFQFDISAQSSYDRGSRMRLELLPLFMIEGLAEYLSQGRIDPQTAMWVRDAALNDKLPDLDKLARDPRISPYQFGQAFWSYVGGRWGDATIPVFFADAGVEGVEEAFKTVLGISPKEFFEQWRASVREDMQPILDSRKATREDLGRPLIGGGDNDLRELNIAPSLSPDGKRVAYLSTRDLFSVDLWLADAGTGAVNRKLVSSEGDPHFDALRFIDSAGSWSPDSRSLAFVVFERGGNKIAIVDVDSGRIARRIEVQGTGALSNPAWSPDGRSIAVSGSVGGRTDLFVVDVDSGSATRLTSDPYGDIQPAWSPDGRSIAFATERGDATNLDTLHYSQLQIGVYDLETNHVSLLPLFQGARNSNPQYDPEGKHLWFIANPDGIPDIFRYGFAGETVERITKVTTGISGITDTAPALSVASRSGAVMFSIFEKGGWNLYRLDPEKEIEETVPTMSASLSPGADLPPFRITEASSMVSDYLADPTKGLPPSDDAFARSSYRPKLRLDYVGPPSVGVGVDRYGLGLAGTLAMTFSDVLGRQQVGFTLEGGSSSDVGSLFGGQVYYLNRASRITWGAVGTHIPYVSASTSAFNGTREVDGQVIPVTIVQQRRDTVDVDELSLVTQYPFGLTRRIEASAGYAHLGFDSRVETVVLDGNQIIDRTVEHIPSIDNFGYARASVAFVGDSSTWGFISPVRGTRYRIEVETNSGGINFETALVDYRRYWFHNPLTLAFRAIHYGRYGTDGEDARLSPLYVGTDTLIRGYDLGSFSFDECTATADSNACPEFDRLIGSRLGILNLEARAPLFGPKGFGLFDVPFLPTEIVAFVDGGVAWTKDQSPKLEFERTTAERIPVFSTGIAARILLGGVLPIQLYYADPLQRPAKGWIFGVTIVPGW